MKYSITLAAYPICNIPSIYHVPNTERTIILDTDTGFGREIWWGYLKMREEQKKNPVTVTYRIERTEKDSESDKFREAINLFFRYLAGEDRDNCERVLSIELWNQ